MKGLNKKIYFELGNWLEKFLHPKIKLADYKKLAQDAIKLLNMTCELDDWNKTISLIKFIKLNDRWQEIYQYTMPEENFIDNSILYKIVDSKIDSAQKKLDIESGEVDKTEQIWLNLISDFYIEFESDYAVNLEYGSLRNTVHEFCCFLNLQIGVIPELFGTILYSDESWSKLVYDFIDFSKEGGIIYGEELEELIRNYKFLSNSIDFKNDNIEEKKIYTGERVLSIFYDGDISWLNSSNDAEPETITYFPWLTVLSHILFRFLKNGGQNSFIFCKCCGRFSFTKKQTVKKYCSDSCRSLARYHNNNSL